MTAPTNAVHRAAHLQALAVRWRAERTALGRRPHTRRGRRATERATTWRHVDVAIAGALEVAEALRADAQRLAGELVVDLPLEARAVGLRRAGLTFHAIAGELHVPVGTCKTWVRRARLGGAA